MAFDNQREDIGGGPFFTYLSCNGKFGLAADLADTVGLATGAIYPSRGEAIGAGLKRITAIARNYHTRALKAEAALDTAREALG